ncbi:alternate-type signal peptide domain-containing protein [uncultured Nocardioides sp.]|uniref:alternate-type signal peptide domain-containing protein n=1 Tax=Nocardioides sp. TaxID=35761 RepID=UPI00261E0C96|nr:alternate-type signal peptide domain-containing protein [uncultured Nocardioides sp.]
MRNSIKAALAATAGAGLLLGGAGSLAYWNDATEVQPDTTLTSGTLDLGAPTCASWKLDDDSDFTPASDTIVPGDSLTRTCQFQISATGDHLTAQLSANVPSMPDSALEDELAFTAVYEIDTDATDDGTGETTVDPDAGAVAFSDADDGSYLRVEFTVDFPFGASVDNDSNGAVSAQLDAITVTATQTNTEHP